MKTSDEGVIALIGHEGVVPGPYLDSVKVLTYGVGHTAAAGSPDPARLTPGMPDNLDAELVRVFGVFRRDLEKYEAAVASAIKVPVAQHEFDAAVSFHFNTGAIHRASWVRSLNAGDRAKAAAQIMNWTKPREIIPRRQSEQELFATGKYPAQGVTVWTVTPDKRVKWVPARQLDPAEALALMRGSVRPDSEAAPDSGAPSAWAPIITAILSLFGKGQK
ncbi:lysozyme [Phaeobacter sp. PT47_59]|uniref:lysozyme n=1 Tax=Phaeobacter sp. PT47_59 TaxID=3029979 RepID=UPI00237FDA2B|nr:lysozyme [Phaeobacter sp. PT47_59]MDE4176347.1 lysozyme [Phaeobacter sp. PT47_59]